ncbi:hypothetical protein [Maridesulfovibrio frigidus]|uniref:hypothetical protein n=1 Tax=Maridesulfovibrio frigidus TaxID=340956 RepID=UPI00068986B3|nr:hypothetical protein [Maridesulfovibrio frigidus]
MSDSVAPDEVQTEVAATGGESQSGEGQSNEGQSNEGNSGNGETFFGDNFNPNKASQNTQGANENPAERSANGAQQEQGKAQPSIDPADYKINYGEGANVQPYIDKQFRDFARENGVSGEMAQKLVDFNGQLEVARGQDQKLQAGKWREETKSLPGWQGASYNKNMGIANNALQAFASPELVNMIVEAGYQNHPEIIKAFHGIGVKMSEDSYVDNKGPSGRKKTMGEILYPNQPV